MFIEHVAVYVENLERTKTFYEDYFGATSNAGYHNPTTGLRTYFLSFPSGARLEIMTRPGYDHRAPSDRLGWLHIAFKLGSQVAVDSLVHRLREDGHQVISGPRTTGDGYYEAVALDPEGNEIELVA